jgi:hypothetical protein
MNTFLDLDASQRRSAIAITAENRSLTPMSIEKDYMVCSALKVLFTLPNATKFITFKGGTSLSKAYGLIERFSEDVDLVVDRELIGADPEPADLGRLSRSAKSKYVRAVQHSLEYWIKNFALQHFSNAPLLSDGQPLWRCRIDDAAQHRDILLLEYDSVLDGPAPDYIRPSVKLEFGARADRWPAQTCSVQSYLGERFPESIQEPPVSVVALCPERTFLEKLCLVHEEVTRGATSTPRSAQSRHFYDLYCLIGAGVGKRAVDDVELFERVVQHRETFYYRPGVDYDSMRSRLFSLVPHGNHLALWKQDYDQLKENMLFGNPPVFDDIIARIQRFTSDTLQ